MTKQFRQLSNRFRTLPERGQILLIVAFSMIGLLVAAGLAVDGGVLFLRKAQLDRAADAAALAGVIDVRDNQSIGLTNQHGAQFMAANGVGVGSVIDCPNVDWDIHDYCGEAGTSTDGVTYRVEVEWCSEVYFMQIIGFGEPDCPNLAPGQRGIPLRTSAVAELPEAFDNYFIGSNGGVIDSPVVPSSLGGNVCDVTDEYEPSAGNKDLAYGTAGGKTIYRIMVPDGYFDTYTYVNIELFDPDTYNTDNPDASGGGNAKDNWIVYRREDLGLAPKYDSDQKVPCNNSSSGSGGGAATACSLDTGESHDANPYWFVRSDEYIDPDDCRVKTNTDPEATSRTVFRLYYVDDDGNEIDLAYYVGAKHTDAGAATTDMKWVTPTNASVYQRKTVLDILTGGYYTDIGTWTRHVDGVTTADREWAYYCSDIFAGTPLLCNIAEVPASYINTPHSYPSVVGAEPVVAPATAGDTCGTLTTNYGSGTCLSYASGAAASVSADSRYDFLIEEAELAGATTDTGGSVSVFLEVLPYDTTSGGENGYNLWAGPYPGDTAFGSQPRWVPSDVNARNMFLVNLRQIKPSKYTDWHSSAGIQISGGGVFRYNSQGQGTTHIPITAVTPQMAGTEMLVRFKDVTAGPSDSGFGCGTSTNPSHGPVYFHLDSFQPVDWAACYDDATGVTPASQQSEWDCSVAPFDGGASKGCSAGDSFTEGTPPQQVNLMYWYQGRAYLDYNNSHKPGSWDWPNCCESDPEYFTHYRFNLPSTTYHAQAPNNPFAQAITGFFTNNPNDPDAYAIDFFRPGILYMTFWAGWEQTYLIDVIPQGGGNPRLIE